MLCLFFMWLPRTHSHFVPNLQKNYQNKKFLLLHVTVRASGSKIPLISLAAFLQTSRSAAMSDTNLRAPHQHLKPLQPLPQSSSPCSGQEGASINLKSFLPWPFGILINQGKKLPPLSFRQGKERICRNGKNVNICEVFC